MTLLRALLISLLFAVPVFAVEPGEVLDDPVLEERARELSKGLRCLVCRNENIDESNADLARDLRLLVRERLVAGDTDEDIIDFVVARYGEYVLLTPRAQGSTLILWIAGPAALVFAMILAALYVRRQRPEPAAATGLSEEEKSRLNELIDE